MDEVEDLDPDKAHGLTKSAESLDEFFKGTGQQPILVEFDAVRIEYLSSEAVNKDVLSQLSLIKHMEEVLGSEEKTLDFLGQQTNFRMARGCGVVKRVFEVHVEDVDNYRTPDPFDLTEIQWPNLIG